MRYIPIIQYTYLFTVRIDADNEEPYRDALGKAMRASFNAYCTRKAIEAITGSRAAADATMMSEDNFEPYIPTALVSRIWRIHDKVDGHGSLRASRLEPEYMDTDAPH